LAVIRRVLSGQDVKVLFDCGAHHGRVTREFKHLFPAAKVFAFEPAPDTHTITRANLAGINGVEVVNAAVGERSGVASFYTHPHSESNSMHQWADGQRVEVKVLALDDFCRERGITHIDVLKMDVEGFELQALRGIETMLAAQEIDVLYLEVRFEPLAPGCVDFLTLAGYLAQKGYRLYGFYNTIFAPHLEFDHSDSIFVSGRLSRRVGTLERER
jgi:FkbM family methyltransferase